MNPRFKPLISQSAESDDNPRPFQLKIVSAETSSAPFKPLSSVLSAAGAGQSGAGSTAGREDQVDPKLETKKQGETITRITVTCNCGRVHEIECEY